MKFVLSLGSIIIETNGGIFFTNNGFDDHFSKRPLTWSTITVLVRHQNLRNIATLLDLNLELFEHILFHMRSYIFEYVRFTRTYIMACGQKKF